MRGELTPCRVCRQEVNCKAPDAKFGFTTNGFGFNFSGVVGQTIVVDGSTNLVDWTPIFTNAASTNAIYFSDPYSTNYSGRFYRARLQ